jgi:hypothetical protein
MGIRDVTHFLQKSEKYIYIYIYLVSLMTQFFTMCKGCNLLLKTNGAIKLILVVGLCESNSPLTTFIFANREKNNCIYLVT